MDYIAVGALPLNPSTMETTKRIPKNEQEALQWLIPALDKPLRNMPLEQFKKAWFAIGYLYSGLHPDETGNHGTEVSHEDDGPFRFRLIEPRLIAPFYVESGWPLVLAPFAEEAWHRYENDELEDDELYCYEQANAGIVDRKKRVTGLLCMDNEW